MTSETEYIMQEGVSPEHRRRPELAGLYRPLDQQDKEWMVALGCNWPRETEEQDWLDKQNKLVTIGSESKRRDIQGSTVYQARSNFLQILPVAKAASQRLKKRLDASSRSKGFLPTDEFIGTQRLLHGYGVDIRHLLEVDAGTIIASPKTILNNLDMLDHYGINAEKLLKKNPGDITPYSSENISQKITTMYKIAHVWGFDKEVVNHILEEVPSPLTHSLGKLFTLGRISSELFSRYVPEDISPQWIKQLMIKTLESEVAAYLKHGKNIRTPKGLIDQARKLEGYTRDELRGYIMESTRDNTDDKGNPADLVVKTYLRHYPISEDEAERLPRLTELPAYERPNDLQRIYEKRVYDKESYKTYRRADTHHIYIDTLNNFLSARQEEQHRWLDIIAAGLQTENASGVPSLRTEEQSNLIANGRDARKQLHASLAKKVLKMRHPDSGVHVFAGEDAVQDGMLKLMMAILTLAERRKDKRPDDIWPYLEEQIKTIKLTTADEEDAHSESPQQTTQIYPPADDETELSTKLQQLYKRFGRQ